MELTATAMTPRHIILPTKRLLWLSDIHLDNATSATKNRFLETLQNTSFDSVMITGDLSVSSSLIGHLTEISKACGSRAILYVPGNHDYFGSSFRGVNHAVKELCARTRNLIPLGNGEIVELSKSTALVGHPGWFDGQAGSGSRTRVKCPDRHLIDDFRHLDRKSFFRKLNLLGEESAAYFRQVLPRALSWYRNVLVASHVPPYTQGLRYDGMGCTWNRQPFFANRAAGNCICGFSKSFPNRWIQIYAGHTHSEASVMIRPNLSLRVAGARPGQPGKGEVLTIS